MKDTENNKLQDNAPLKGESPELLLAAATEDSSFLSSVKDAIGSFFESKPEGEDAADSQGADKGADADASAAGTEADASSSNNGDDAAEIIGVFDSGGDALVNENGQEANPESVPRDLTIADIEEMTKAEAGGEAGGHDSDLTYNPYGLPYLQQSVPRDLGIGNTTGIVLQVFLPPLPPVLVNLLNPPPPPDNCNPLVLDNDSNSVKAVVTVCDCDCAEPKLKSSTAATGNLLSNDQINDDTVIARIIDSKHPNGVTPDANGDIIIDGVYGTLTVHTTGPNAGEYTYVLDLGVIPKDGVTDVFTYDLVDLDCKLAGNATLTINIGVETIHLPESEAVNDCNSICVVETICGCDDPSTAKVKSSTTASGNLLSNDINIDSDPSTIVKISDSKHPNGVTPDANGDIIIDGEFGTLTVHTTGPNAGEYTYVLDQGVVPKDGQVDKFTYSLLDSNCGETTTADLKINIDVHLIHLPEAKAVDDCNSICVVETICGCDCESTAKVKSSTTATGNLLDNDKNIDSDPSSIIKISDSKHPNGVVPDANGDIIIEGKFGTLTVHTTGPNAGDYSYVLNLGVVPKDGQVDKFTYTLLDSNCGETTCADLKISMDVHLIHLPEAKAVDDCNSICVVETICGCDNESAKVKSSTTAEGNLLSNDKNIDCDPSSIIKISDSKHPNGVVPDANGDIIIEGKFGTLTVHTTGPNAGEYSYVLNLGVVPKDGQIDKFTYTLLDGNCGETTCADLKINIDVHTIYLPEAKAVDDCNSICVVETVCGCDNESAKVKSSTTAEGNLLSNDKNIDCDPSSIIKISDSKHPNGVVPNANGDIIIEGQFGTLTVHTTGAHAGEYSYVLNQGVVPKDGQIDKFTYTLLDGNCGETTCADLKINIDVHTIQLPESKAVDDCASICVVESQPSGCDSSPKVKSSTTASGNLLNNDTNINEDPSCIIRISDSKHPNGVMPNAVGDIIIDGLYGTLTVHTTGAHAGEFSYVLNPGVLPKDGNYDVFTYTLKDSNCGDTTCADLKVKIDVQTIVEPPPKCEPPPPCHDNPPPCDSKPPVCDDKPPCDSKPPVCDDKPPCESKPPVCDDKPPCESKPPVCDDKPPCEDKPPVCEPPKQPDCGCDEKVSIQVQFKNTDASYDNSFGYYIKDANGNPLSGVIIWAGAHEAAANATYTINCVNPCDIGFFIIPNGDNLNAGLHDGEHVNFINVNGVWEAQIAGSNIILNGTDAHVYFDQGSLNIDHISHLQTSVNGDVTTQGWEDLLNGGDKDYNDVIIQTTQTACNTCDKKDDDKPPHHEEKCEDKPRQDSCQVVCDDNKPKGDDKDNHHDKKNEDKHNDDNCIVSGKDKDDHAKDCNDNAHKDNRGHDSKDCDVQPTCGNVIKDNCDNSHDGLYIAGFKYYDKNNNLCSAKCGEKVVTHSGAEFCMNKDGSYSHTQPDHNKSFCDDISYTIKGSHGYSEKSSFSIHTADCAPQSGLDDESSHKSNYIVDISDLAPKHSLSMKEVGINNLSNHSANDNQKQGLEKYGLSAQAASDNHASQSHALPLLVNEHSGPHAVEQHFQQAVQETHVMK